jgi:hypothetical protein
VATLARPKPRVALAALLVALATRLDPAGGHQRRRVDAVFTPAVTA